MKILLVEDSRLLAGSIKRQLSRQHVVDIAYSGEDGLYQARATDYSMLVLDLGLPDMNGYEVCRQLRRQRIDTPILVLSGTRDADTRVRLLECGADDYVTKPFDSAELLARVNALLRRSSRQSANQQLRYNDVTIDLGQRSVVRAGVSIRLRRKEFDILYYLVQNQGRPISRDAIFNHVWESGKGGWNNTIDVHIKHLRDKVDRPFKKKIIKTAYGIGYMVDKAE